MQSYKGSTAVEDMSLLSSRARAIHRNTNDKMATVRRGRSALDASRAKCSRASRGKCLLFGSTWM